MQGNRNNVLRHQTTFVDAHVNYIIKNTFKHEVGLFQSPGEWGVSIRHFDPGGVLGGYRGKRKKDNGEKTEMVWARHEDGRRSRSEESDDESDTGEKEERETKDKVEGCVQEGHADCRTERGRCRRQGLLERDDQQP